MSLCRPKETQRTKTSANEMYTCHCAQKCGGIPHRLIKRVYQQNATFRQQETEFQQEGKGSATSSDGQVWFSLVLRAFFLNPELDPQFSSTYCAELRTEPLVPVLKGSVLVQPPRES